MAHGSRLMAHASELVAQGQTKIWQWMPEAPGPSAKFLWAMSHEPLIIDELMNYSIRYYKYYIVLPLIGTLIGYLMPSICY